MKQFPRPITELNLRAQVVITLLQVQQGQSLASLLHQQLVKFQNVIVLCFMNWYWEPYANGMHSKQSPYLY
jgi:hypothetical protein